MELLINNYPIDFSLELEKTLEDIIASIMKWTHERELIFFQVEIDGKAYPIDELPRLNIDDIKQVNCIVQSKSDVVFSTIDEGIAYSERAITFIDSCLEHNTINENELANLGQGIGWLLEVFDKITELLDLDVNNLKYKDKSFQDYLHELIEIKEEITAKSYAEHSDLLSKSKETFLGLSDIFRMILLSEEMRQLIIKSIDSPDVLILSLSEIQDQMPDQLQNIEDVAISFQTGKDSKGSEGLQRFIDFMFRYTRTCYQIVPVFAIDLGTIEINGKSLEAKNREMQNLLNQTMEIMENNDIISLSDILEYEIKPLLEDIDQFMEKLMEAIADS